MEIDKDTTKRIISKEKILSFFNADLELDDEVINAFKHLNAETGITKKTFETWHDAFKKIKEIFYYAGIPDKLIHALADFMVAYNLVTIYNIGTGFVIRLNYLAVLQLDKVKEKLISQKQKVNDQKSINQKAIEQKRVIEYGVWQNAAINICNVIDNFIIKVAVIKLIIIATFAKLDNGINLIGKLNLFVIAVLIYLYLDILHFNKKYTKHMLLRNINQNIESSKQLQNIILKGDKVDKLYLSLFALSMTLFYLYILF